MNKTRLAVVAVVAAGLMVGCSIAAPVPVLDPEPVPAYLNPEPIGDPQYLTIPAISIKNSKLMKLGQNPDGSIEVPILALAKTAGWYSPGPEPGEIGPAVIVGHVNGGRAIGVFANLHFMKPGDTIQVDSFLFQVTEVEKVIKTNFPKDKVFGKTATPQLRLITCGGQFDQKAASYEDNIIVYASKIGG